MQRLCSSVTMFTVYSNPRNILIVPQGPLSLKWKIHYVNILPIFQDFLLLLNLHAVISKWYPSTACQLNDRKFECVFPAYCYCHSIFRHWKHALSGCLQTHHCNLFYLKHGCKYSLFSTYTKPDSSLDFYYGFLFPLEVSRIWSFLYSVFVTICPVLHAL